MSNGSLPQTIPPQTASLGKADADGNVTIDITWYLLLYNLSHQVLSQPNGAIPGSSIDLLLIDSIDASEIPNAQSSNVVLDSADIDSVSADVAKLSQRPQDVDSGDIDASGADTAQLLSALQTAQALISEIIDSASAIDAANASKLLGATWSAPGAIGSGTPNTISGTTGAFSSTPLQLQQNQNAATEIISRNDTSGTAAQALFSASYGAFSQYIAGAVYSPTFTATGLRVANSAGLFSAGNSAGLRIYTIDNYPVYIGVNDAVVGTFSSTGLAVTGTISTKGYTVATLPSGVVGMHAYVTDAVAPTFLGLLVGGGTVTTPVFYNGSAWVSD